MALFDSYLYTADDTNVYAVEMATDFADALGMTLDTASHDPLPSYYRPRFLQAKTLQGTTAAIRNIIMDTSTRMIELFQSSINVNGTTWTFGSFAAEAVEYNPFPGIKGDKGDTGDPGANGTNGTNGSNASATTDASDLTSGTLALARLADSSIPGTKLSASAGITGSQMANNTVATAQIDTLVLQVVTVTLSSTDIKNLHTTPITVIASPGAGKSITVLKTLLSYTYGGTAYTGAGNFTLKIGTSSLVTMANGISQTTARQSTNVQNSGDGVDNSNAPLVLTNTGSAFVTGNGTVKFFVWYAICPL